MHGGVAGHMGGGRSVSGGHSGGMRSGPGVSHGFTHTTSNGNWHGSTWNHGSHSNHVHFNTFHNCFGAFCGHSAFNSRWWGGGWGWGWGWSPWLWSSWDDQDRRFDEDYYRQYALADQWNQQSLAEQRMRQQEEADGDQDAYAPRSSNRHSAPESAVQPQEPVPATVLVFRDRRQQEVQNYAIVGQTLWAFSVGRTQKIPISDLDISATEKANNDRGLTFRIPGMNEGQ